MKLFQKNVLRILYILLLTAVLLIPAFAEDAEYPLYVYSNEVGGQVLEEAAAAVSLFADAEVPTFTISDNGIAFIVQYEGFNANPYWDVSRYSIGYGCSYEAAKEMFGEDCAPITEEQAMALLKAEMASTETYMNNFFVNNSIVLNQNQYDALMSFTYNVGIGWTTYKNSDGSWCKLKTLLLSDSANWTADAVQAALGTWVNDGNGNELAGLVKRRAAEAVLFMTPWEGDSQETEQEDVFPDVKISDWFYSEVMEAYELGLVSGTDDGNFKPGDALTRSQMVKLLANFHGVGDMDDNVETQFPDVAAGEWYTAEVAWAAEEGYVLGCDDGNFHPDDPITREQMCTILARYLQQQGHTTEIGSDLFLDDAQISGYAWDSIYFCAALGLVNGTSDGAVAPADGATRAQAAAVMLRAYKLG